MSSGDTNQDFRYERKYLTTTHQPTQLVNAVLTNPLIFKPIYHPRLVNSLYFDTPNWELLQQNILGVTPRFKVRVRWYQDSASSQLSPLQIEIKIRQAEVITKKVFNYNQTIDSLSSAKLKLMVRQQLEPYLQQAHSLQPVLANSYHRQYLYSRWSELRVTIDSKLQFANLTDWHRQAITHQIPATILEAKYSLPQDKQIRQLTSNLPVQISKSSKYVMGMTACYPQNGAYSHDY